jgi:CHAT domain-containing protein/Tfp pilus assembly protein PilF
MLAVPLGLGVLLFLAHDAARGQAPASPVVAPKQLQERDKLVKQVDELRQAGKFDEAVPIAERVLELERVAGDVMTARVADALSRLAELAELRGDWTGAIARRKEAIAVRARVDGKDHWRTADARLALAFDEKVAGRGQPDQTKVAAALRKEQEAGRLSAQGKYAEAERPALEALDTYQAVVGAESPEVARMWHAIGRYRFGRNDGSGAKQATVQAIAIRRKVLPGNHPDLGKSLMNLGLAERALGNQRRARDLVSEAVRVFRASLGPGDVLTATGLTNLGVVQVDLREYAAAKASLEEALAIYRKALPNHDPRVVASLNRLGAVQHDHLREYAAAKLSFEEALAIGRKSLPKDHPDVAMILFNLGNARSSLRDYAAAKVSYEEALAIRRKALPKDHPDIAHSLNNLGTVQSELREYEAAVANYKEALAIRRKVLPRDHPDVAQSLNNLGLVQKALRENGAAKASFEQALAICRTALPKDHPQIASSLNNLGNVQRELREYASAKASHEEALAISRKVRPKDHPDIAQSLNNLGLVQEILRENGPAKASFKEALAIYRKALPKDHPHIAAILNNLGAVQGELREYTAARASLEEALGIRRKALPNDHPDIAISLNELGLMQLDLRDYAAAKASFEEALASRHKALPEDRPNIAKSLDNLGNLQRALREYAAARASYEEALAIRRKALPNDHPDIASSLIYLGTVQHDLRQYTAAKASHEEALAILRKALPKDHPHIARCLFNLGRLSLDSGVDIRDALPILTEATDLYQADQLRSAVVQAEPEQLITAGTSQSSLSLLLTAVLISKADARPVYDRVVRGKGSVTAQQRWVRQARDAADPDTTRLLDRLRQVTDQIVGLSLDVHPSDRSSDAQNDAASLRALCDERARMEQQLSEHSAAFRTIQGRARVGSDDVQAALPKGTALVDLVDFHVEAATEDGKEPIHEHRIAAFVLRPAQREAVLVSLGSTQSLADLIDRWRSSYGAGKPPAAGGSDPGVELRKRLWEPLEKHLRSVNVVLVSPDGPLNGLPWAALPGTKEGTFLIQEHAFAVVPVPQLQPELLGRGTGQKADPASLVVGNIDFDARPDRAPATVRENHFSPLPGTTAEATAVHDLFRTTFAGRPAALLVGKEATKEGFVRRASNCSHLLVATHGFFLSESKQTQLLTAQRTRSLDSLLLHPDVVTTNPALRSGLVFAGANYATVSQGNSFLTALEASDLDLHRVDLAVLSACETGLGKIEGGEGVLGLQRAFQLAGARTTVTSLWKVPDSATQALMTRFHRNLWQRKMSKLEALREAQVWMIQEGRNHPELGLRGGLERPEPKSNERDPVSPFYWAAFVLSGDWR